MAAPAHAQPQGSTASGVATATVVAPLSAVSLRDLDFGTVAVGAMQGGSVAIVPGRGSGARYDGSARPACLSGAQCATPHSAQFRVSGEGDRDYRIAIPVAVAARADSGSGSTLAVEALTVRSASRPDAGPQGRLDPSGSDTFEIGGTIRIPAGTQADRYRAPVEILLTYG